MKNAKENRIMRKSIILLVTMLLMALPMRSQVFLTQEDLDNERQGQWEDIGLIIPIFRRIGLAFSRSGLFGGSVFAFAFRIFRRSAAFRRSLRLPARREGKKDYCGKNKSDDLFHSRSAYL